MVAIIFLNIILVLYIIKCFIYLVTLFQQNHYDLKKTSYSLGKYYLRKTYQYYYYVGIIFVVLSLFYDVFGYIASALLLVSFIHRNHYVIRLKFTKRIIRLLFTSSLIIFIPMIFCFRFILVNYCLVMLLPIVLVLANLINYPVEQVIKKYYKKKAIKKIDKMETLTKIAITGSFGKTSTKDIITQILSSKYLTLKTPASYNTMMGLSLTINNQLNPETEIFVMEMGAFFVGEIEQMSRAFRPNIAIITEIGMQHMSTFKSVKNIAKAKFEIASSLDQNGCLILNYDNEYIRDYDKSKIVTNHIYTYGIERGDYHIKNLVFNGKETTFSIFHFDHFVMDIKTNLLGRHHVLNILAAFTTLKALERYHIYIDNETFQKVVAKITPTLHRLSYREEGMYHIYDDSYSSNIIGFKNASEVLSMQEGRKIIITPGIVDGGEYDQSINEEIAKVMIDIFDEIYLINNKSSQVIAQILKDKKINYLIFSSFKEAYLTILSKYNRSDEIINILIENDLPDSFLER